MLTIEQRLYIYQDVLDIYARYEKMEMDKISGLCRIVL